MRRIELRVVGIILFVCIAYVIFFGLFLDFFLEEFRRQNNFDE